MPAKFRLSTKLILARMEMRDCQRRRPSRTYKDEEEEEEEREEEVVEEEEVEERDESRWTILPTSLFQTGSMILSRRHLIWVSWHSWSSCTQPERELYRQNIRPFVIFGHL